MKPSPRFHEEVEYEKAASVEFARWMMECLDPKITDINRVELQVSEVVFRMDRMQAAAYERGFVAGRNGKELRKTSE